MTVEAIPDDMSPGRGRFRWWHLATAGIVVCGLVVALLDWSDRTAREVADGVVEALRDGDSEAYASLLCTDIRDDPVRAIPPVISKNTLTVTLRGLKYYPGENRSDGKSGQKRHYRATVAVETTNTDLLLMINEQAGSWCLLRAHVCPTDGTVDTNTNSGYIQAMTCSGRPYEITD
ncbi:hypothetical protein [Saccharothrix luteola]|uniref:hypothetical protein n=1 Tax=Saccharothrix luteola TaxID=2893018 RepID=UPI001E39B58F|nr:hypothetical protein [Saccharothrix luteola]MCC8242788.1 hypothetical protein [Saccharothrix luteola]